MRNPVELERYVPAEHKNLLWKFYKDERYAEFFRRFPPTWRLEDIEKIEDVTGSQMFLCRLDGVHGDLGVIGFACIAKVCWYELSAQVGLMLFEEYQDESRNGHKFALWCMFALAHIFFDKMTLRRMSFVFLKRRQDIEKSLMRSGLRCEGTFLKRINYQGVWEDELEYCLDKEQYDMLYKS